MIALLLPLLLPVPLEAGALALSLTAQEPQADAFAALSAEYEAAVAAHQKAIAETDDKTVRSELRKNPPAVQFWARFEALAATGEGRATLWLATHLREKGVKASERGAPATAYFEALFQSHSAAEWFHEVIAALVNEGKIEDAKKVTLLRGVVGSATNPRTQAPALFALGQLLYGEDATKAEGKALLDQVAREHTRTQWGTLARAMFITAAELEVGQPAPDFFGETIDGFGFNLSDYRGKVVLLDFYGFW